MDNMIWFNFLINVLGVILGIILTFGVNSLWRNREEKKRTKDMLILVRNELVTNKEIFKIQEEFLKRDGYVYQKILEAKNNLADIPTDKLKEYHLQILGLNIVSIKTSAWQIFQNSEMIQKMTNKEIVIRLTDCYASMTSWYNFIMTHYWETKRKILVVELDDSYKFFDKILKNNEAHNFFDDFSLDKEDKWEAFLMIDAFIDYSLMLLDKHGNYKYDMDGSDKELSTYLEERMMKYKERNQVKEEN